MLVLFDYHNYPPVRTVIDFAKPKSGAPRPDLKGQCHEDFAVLIQFCAKIITLRL